MNENTTSAKKRTEEWRKMNLSTEDAIKRGYLKVAHLQIQGIQDEEGTPVALVQTTVLTEIKGTPKDAL